MLDVTLFTRPVFTGAVLANLLSVFSLVGFLYFVSQHLQLVSGRSPMEAGLVQSCHDVSEGGLAVALAERRGLDPDHPRSLTRSVILT